MVFYAYATSVSKRPPFTRSLLITATGLERLDEWFRAIQAVVADDVIKRSSPELYRYNSNKLSLVPCLDLTGVYLEFAEHLLFAPLVNAYQLGWTVFYNSRVVDQVSGES
jgi:hypothetical protein